MSILTEILVDSPIGDVIQKEAQRKRAREEVLQKYAQKKMDLDLQYQIRNQYEQPAKSISDSAKEAAYKKYLQIEEEKRLGIYREPSTGQKTPEQSGIASAQKKAAQIEEEKRLGIYEEPTPKTNESEKLQKEIDKINADIFEYEALSTAIQSDLKNIDDEIYQAQQVRDSYAREIERGGTYTEKGYIYDSKIPLQISKDDKGYFISVPEGSEGNLVTSSPDYQRINSLIETSNQYNMKIKNLERKKESIINDYEKVKQELIKKKARQQFLIAPDKTSYQIKTESFSERLKKFYS